MTVTNRVAKIIEWDISGNIFFGSVREDNNLVQGLVTPEHPESGAFFSLNHQWVITANSSKLTAVIQVFYQFTNNKQKPTVEQLFELTKDSAISAADCLNNELRNKMIEIIPRTAPEIILDGWLHSFLQ